MSHINKCNKGKSCVCSMLTTRVYPYVHSSVGPSCLQKSRMFPLYNTPLTPLHSGQHPPNTAPYNCDGEGKKKVDPT